MTLKIAIKTTSTNPQGGSSLGTGGGVVRAVSGLWPEIRSSGELGVNDTSGLC